MIKAVRFRISDKPYAVAPDTYQLANGVGRGEIWAAWFRRRTGVTVACVGTLRDYQTPRQETAAGFLAAFTDSPYGGNCVARWDGTSLWSHADESAREQYKKILVPMLAAYPEVPEGYDGWWIFERPKA